MAADPGGDVELRQDVADVALDRFHAERERVGDLLVGFAGGDQAQHLNLAGRETVAARVGPMDQERVDPGDVRASAEARVGRPRGLELHPPPFPIAEHAAGEAERLARAGRRVRDLERLPLLPGEPQEDQRLARVSRGQLDGALGLSGRRPQHSGGKPRHDLRELGAGGPGAFVVASGQQDLDPGRQQARALEWLDRRVEGAPDGGGRRARAPPRQPQQREPRLRLGARPARAAIGVLGGVELPAQPQDLALLVERRAGRMLVDPLGVLLARPAASASASAHAPWSCRISARCTRHVEVKIIICRWSWHQRLSAAVHSRARPSSWTRWQQLITLQ